MMAGRLRSHLILLTCLLTLASQPARADEAETPTAPRLWSMGFGWSQGDALEGMRGADFTLQHEGADARHAWRFGLGLYQNAESGTNTYRDYYFPGPFVVTEGGDSRTNLSDYGVTALRLSQHGDPHDVRFSWGIGPLVGWSRRHDRQVVTHAEYAADSMTLSYTGTLDQVQSTIREGLAGAIGVRWPLTSKIDATAEFEQALLYRSERLTFKEDFPGSFGFGHSHVVRNSGVVFQARTLRAAILVRI
jgi:hypothetical protein